MPKATINSEICKGCALCVTACPQKIIELNDTNLNSKGYPPAQVTDMSRCTGCAACANMCPDSAIEVER